MKRRHSLETALLTLVLAMPAWAQGGPPLRTDDPGTPGNGNWEVNLAVELEDGEEERTWAAAVDVNYGLGERIQLKLEVPWVFVTGGGRTRDGLGRPQVGVKWRFLDRGHTSASIYPQVELEGPGSAADRGLVDDETELLLPLQVARSLGGIDLNFEVGYALRSGGDEWLAGLALGHELSSAVEILAEVHGSGSVDGGGEEWVGNLGLRLATGESLSVLASAGRGLAGGSDEHDLIAFVGLQMLF